MANPAPGFQRHPDHTITLSPPDRRVRVRLGDAVIADSTAAIALEEHRYPPRLYLPAADVRFERLAPNDRTTHCPFKGDARYWSVDAPGGTVQTAVWAYDAPFDEMAAIEGRLCFDGSVFEILEG